MRKPIYSVLVLTLLLAAAPSFAACRVVSMPPGPWFECIDNPTFADTSYWSVSPSGNVITSHPGETMCSTNWTDFAKSTGAYGYATMEQSFTLPSGGNDVFSIKLAVELKNSHNSSLNRLSVLVYNDTDSTSETIATIDGSNGDICSTTYIYQVTRPAWSGDNLRLSIQENFWHSDAQFNVTQVSFIEGYP